MILVVMLKLYMFYIKYLLYGARITVEFRVLITLDYIINKIPLIIFQELLLFM